MALTSQRRRRAKCDASLDRVVCSSSPMGMEVAVVSQRPGSWGSVAVGSVVMEVGTGTWREKERVGVSSMWAMRDLEMLV
jgi:hypothetical protein